VLQGCVPSEKFDVGVIYSHVCGRMVAYQIGKPDGYKLFSTKNEFDGISLTYESR